MHPYLTVDGQKLSKSRGPRVDPVELDGRYGTDSLRCYYAREVGEVSDTDFTVERLVARTNEDLANALGNVTNRIVTLVHRYRGGYVPIGVEPYRRSLTWDRQPLQPSLTSSYERRPDSSRRP